MESATLTLLVERHMPTRALFLFFEYVNGKEGN